MAGEQEKKKLHAVSYASYYMLLFFAHWFGSARFDVDGDGEFDPEDVEAWLQDHNFLHNNYKRTGSKAKRGGLALGVSTSNPAKSQSAPSTSEKSASKAEPAAETQSAAGTQSESQAEGNVFDRHGDGDVDLMNLASSKVDGEAEEDIAMHNLATGQILPLFIMTECALCFGLWLIFSLVEGGGDFLETKAGLDSIAEHQTDLRFYGTECQDLRWQFWRWLTYQFTHVGLVHIVMNVLLNTILGVPLEGAEGHWRMFLMFNAGVLGGAMANMFLDGHSVVVGCSGGCYSLIGIHTADLLLNWGQKKFRIPTLVLILLLVTVDVGFGVASSGEGDQKSHTSHVGGAAAGLLIGIIVGKNLKMHIWEKVFIGIALFLSLFLTVFSFAWLFTRSDGPQNIFEAINGEDGWCWTRQVADETFPELMVYCVKCGTEACVDHFSSPDIHLSKTVLMSVCEDRGWWDHGY